MLRGEQSRRLQVRLPADVKAWLVMEASRNRNSQGSEIVRALREKMDRQLPDQPGRKGLE